MTNQVKRIVIPEEQINIWSHATLLVRDGMEFKKSSASDYATVFIEACENLIESIIENVDPSKLDKVDFEDLSVEQCYKLFSTTNIPANNELRLVALSVCALTSWLLVLKKNSATWWALFEKELDFIKVEFVEPSIVNVRYEGWTFNVIPMQLDEYVSINTCVMGVFSNGFYTLGLPVVVPEVESEIVKE